jgi:hypothetical protein
MDAVRKIGFIPILPAFGRKSTRVVMWAESLAGTSTTFSRQATRCRAIIVRRTIQVCGGHPDSRLVAYLC